MKLYALLYSLQYRFRQKLTAWSFGLLKYRSAPVSSPSNPQKVLFVLAGLIGDSVMSLPVISEARKIWPEARITVLGKKHNRELIAACPIFDEFYECNADPFSIRRSAEINSLRAWMSEQAFDVAIILLGDQFAHLLANAEIPVRVGVKGTSLEKCLTHSYDIGGADTWGTNERLNALRSLGYNVGPAVPELSVTEAARISVTEKLENCGLDSTTDYAVFHPFGSTPAKWWPLENTGQLADDLAKKYGLKLVVVGKQYSLNGVVVSPTMSEDSNPNVVNTLGALELPELLAAIDGAKFVISTDSGPFHIAGALGKRTVGLFRKSCPYHAFGYGNTSSVFGLNEVCMAECDSYRCRKDPCEQMKSISTASVLDMVARII